MSTNIEPTYISAKMSDLLVGNFNSYPTKAQQNYLLSQNLTYEELKAELIRALNHIESLQNEKANVKNSLRSGSSTYSKSPDNNANLSKSEKINNSRGLSMNIGNLDKEILSIIKEKSGERKAQENKELRDCIDDQASYITRLQNEIKLNHDKLKELDIIQITNQQLKNEMVQLNQVLAEINEKVKELEIENKRLTIVNNDESLIILKNYMNFIMDILNEFEDKHFIKKCFTERFINNTDTNKELNNRQYDKLCIKAFKYFTDLILNMHTHTTSITAINSNNNIANGLSQNKTLLAVDSVNGNNDINQIDHIQKVKHSQSNDLNVNKTYNTNITNSIKISSSPKNNTNNNNIITTNTFGNDNNASGNNNDNKNGNGNDNRNIINNSNNNGYNSHGNNCSNSNNNSNKNTSRSPISTNIKLTNIMKLFCDEDSITIKDNDDIAGNGNGGSNNNGDDLLYIKSINQKVQANNLKPDILELLLDDKITEKQILPNENTNEFRKIDQTKYYTHYPSNYLKYQQQQQQYHNLQKKQTQIPFSANISRGEINAKQLCGNFSNSRTESPIKMQNILNDNLKIDKEIENRLKKIVTPTKLNISRPNIPKKDNLVSNNEDHFALSLLNLQEANRKNIVPKYNQEFCTNNANNAANDDQNKDHNSLNKYQVKDSIYIEENNDSYNDNKHHPLSNIYSQSQLTSQTQSQAHLHSQSPSQFQSHSHLDSNSQGLLNPNSQTQSLRHSHSHSQSQPQAQPQLNLQRIFESEYRSEGLYPDSPNFINNIQLNQLIQNNTNNIYKTNVTSNQNIPMLNQIAKIASANNSSHKHQYSYSPNKNKNTKTKYDSDNSKETQINKNNDKKYYIAHETEMQTTTPNKNINNRVSYNSQSDLQNSRKSIKSKSELNGNSQVKPNDYKSFKVTFGRTETVNSKKKNIESEYQTKTPQNCIIDITHKKKFINSAQKSLVQHILQNSDAGIQENGLSNQTTINKINDAQNPEKKPLNLSISYSSPHLYPNMPKIIPQG